MRGSLGSAVQREMDAALESADVLISVRFSKLGPLECHREQNAVSPARLEIDPLTDLPAARTGYTFLQRAARKRQNIKSFLNTCERSRKID